MIKNPLVRPLLLIIMSKMERWADMIPVIGVWIVLRFFGISQVTTLAVAAAMVCVEILARLSAIERKLQQFEAGPKRIE